MALNSSGPISLGGTTAGQSIALENGGSGTSTISLNDSAVRSLAGVASGQIVMPTNFWGKSNSFAFNLTSGTDLNLRTQALSAGWNGSSNVVATIPVSNTIQSSSTGTPALTINGSFPSGVKLINNGSIIGRGGNGGAGGTGTPTVGSPGNNAGPALFVSISVVIDNSAGAIRGGGGGGGGGGGARGAPAKSSYGCGGGGGGGGIGVSSGGAGGLGAGPGTLINGNPGNPGTISSAGTGGTGASGGGVATAGNGGTGGGFGSNGSSGTTGTANQSALAGGSGGSAGYSVNGYSNVTWISTGTLSGPTTG